MTANCDDPIGHKWRGVSADVAGRGSLSTEVIEQCERCGVYRLNENPEFLGERET